MDPLSGDLDDLKERNEVLWKLANENTVVVNLFWEEGGTILEALGRVSPEYVEYQLANCIHPGAESCDRCQALAHLFDIELTGTEFLCQGCI